MNRANEAVTKLVRVEELASEPVEDRHNVKEIMTIPTAAITIEIQHGLSQRKIKRMCHCFKYQQTPILVVSDQIVNATAAVQTEADLSERVTKRIFHYFKCQSVPTQAHLRALSDRTGNAINQTVDQS